MQRVTERGERCELGALQLQNRYSSHVCTIKAWMKLPDKKRERKRVSLLNYETGILTPHKNVMQVAIVMSELQKADGWYLKTMVLYFSANKNICSCSQCVQIT